MPSIKVAIVHNTIAPYRHPLFERLSETVDLTVYYCSMKHTSRNWDLWPRNYNYRYKILPRIPIRELSLNPSIVKERALNRPHVLVLGGYVDPTMWLAFAMSKLLKIPVIYWTEGIKEPKSILGMITRPLRMLFVKKASAVVVPGKLSRSYIIGLGADVEKVFIAPNTIDNELFVEVSRKYQSDKEGLKGQLGLKGKVVILYVGRLVKGKGITFLFEAYSKLKSQINYIALVIVGYGKLYNILRKLCQEKRINDAIFTGAIVNHRQLIKYYSVADIFVLPTLEDVWGFVINEAMACGLPIVATRASQAAREMIRSGENGYIIKEADSKELYNVLKKLVYNSRLRKKMGEKSGEIVRREFDVSRMVEGFLSAIKYCTKGMRK